MEKWRDVAYNMEPYIPFGLTLTQGQKAALGKAARAGTAVTIRLPLKQLHGDDKLGLTRRQIAHIEKKRAAGAGAELTLSKTQLKAIARTGGFLPLLPLILGGLSAAGALAGGSAAIAKAVDDSKANARAQAEAQRHNREVEGLLKGSGLYLAAQKRGGCVACRRGKKKKKAGSGLYLAQKN